MLIVISGPSGAGKGTIIKEVLKRKPDIVYSVSYTTRPKREGEENGKDYFFISKERFEEMIKNGEFLEWAKVYDYYYGTSKEFVLKKLREGKDVILEIEIQGARKVREIFDRKNTIFIFIAPPSFKELKKRIEKRRRGESEEEIRKRLNFAKEEIKEAEKYDYIVINDDVDRAVEEVLCIINREKGGEDFEENKL